MRIAVLGTGVLARALGGRWVRAGHDVVVAGRSATKAAELAARLGARAAEPRAAVDGVEAVLLAVSHTGVDDVLDSVGVSAGTLAGVTVIDPVNAVEHGVGVLLRESSVAEHVARRAPGAHVVKAFHLFPATQWSDPSRPAVTVPLCGDHPDGLRIASALARDVGGVPVVLGALDRARQLEETAGFVIGLAFRGVDPRSAVPSA